MKAGCVSDVQSVSSDLIVSGEALQFCLYFVTIRISICFQKFEVFCAPERFLCTYTAMAALEDSCFGLSSYEGIHLRDYEGRSLLHRACMEGRMDVVSKLLSEGADIDAEDRWGNQPLNVAILHGHSDIADLLRGFGAKLSSKNVFDVGYRLCRSAAEGDLSRAKSLIQCKVSVNSLDYDKRTPLHLAAANGSLHMVNFLLSCGVDIMRKDRLGRDALDEAIDAGHVEVEEALRASVFEQDMQPFESLNLDSLDEGKMGSGNVAMYSACTSACSPPNLNNPARLIKAASVAVMSSALTKVCDVSKGNLAPEDISIVNFEAHSSLARYLTAKGSTVDKEICWRDPANHEDLALADFCKRTESGPASFDGSASSVNSSSKRKHTQQQDFKLTPLQHAASAPSDGMPLDSLRFSRRNSWVGDLSSLCARGASLGLPSLGSLGSTRLRHYVAAGATVLLIDIKGFTAGCARMSAAEVGEWVADFYERVDEAAAAHGVRKAEVRGDCCICVAGTSAAVPWASLAGVEGGADGREDQVTRMLAFASDLHAALAVQARADGPAMSVRMGVATGDVAVRMEALSEPGAVLVHRSAVDKWVAEAAGRAAADPGAAGGRIVPALVQVECPERGPQEAAAFDCARRAFRWPRPAVPPPLPPGFGRDGRLGHKGAGAGAGDEPPPKRLARSASFS